MAKASIDYILQLADNALIYGHRLSEWCGHAPVLEVDMAMANISLDSIGAARSFYQYAAEIEGNGKTEDSYPYLRNEREFKNVLLVEQKNGDFADTLARNFYFDCFQYVFYNSLQNSTDTQIAAIASKSMKEVNYHLRFSKNWICKLGDGTEESKKRIQESLHHFYTYCGELFNPTKLEIEMQEQGIAPKLDELKIEWKKIVTETIENATLVAMDDESLWYHTGGKNGLHSEHMGYILTELQYMQRAFPNCEW